MPLPPARAFPFGEALAPPPPPPVFATPATAAPFCPPLPPPPALAVPAAIDAELATHLSRSLVIAN